MRAAEDIRSVSRILYGVAAADGHSSRPIITDRLKRPTRKFGVSSRDALKTACAILNSFPIWSCSVWGLPCPVHYCAGGALLPHLFTLTASSTQGLRNGLRLLCPRARFEQNGSHRSAHPQSNISGFGGLAPALPSRPAQKRIGFRHSLMYGGIFSVALSVEPLQRRAETRH